MTPALALGIGFSALLGAVCACWAERKNRSVAGWFVFGALFGLGPLLVFAMSGLAPARNVEAWFALRLLFKFVPLGALWALPSLPHEEWQP